MGASTTKPLEPAYICTQTEPRLYDSGHGCGFSPCPACAGDMRGLAKRMRAKIFQASTREV